MYVYYRNIVQTKPNCKQLLILNLDLKFQLEIWFDLKVQYFEY